MTDDAMLLYGTQEVEDPGLHLTAGPVGALFVAGALRDIRYAGVEVIRGLHFLARDRNWATVVPVLSNVDVHQEQGRFEIAYAARGRTPSDGQEIAWKGRIEASRDGLRFDIEATAEADFVTCRTGFVVLHPLEKVAGCPVTVEHTDGRLEASSFPELIDPLQCFFDVAALTHEPIPGLRATCRMEGGAWETEDHRNWMDASFKTYFRPLALPKPYAIPTGEVVRQMVTLGFDGRAPAARPEPAPVVVLGDRTGQEAPRIGLIAEGSDLVAGPAHAAEVRALGAQYLVLRVARATARIFRASSGAATPSRPRRAWRRRWRSSWPTGGGRWNRRSTSWRSPLPWRGFRRTPSRSRRRPT